MKITFDPQADALYIELHSIKVHETKEVGEGIFLDYDEKGELRGIEILYASQRAPEVIRGHVDIHIPIHA